MTITPFGIYLISLADNLSIFAFVISTISCITVLTCIAAGVSAPECYKNSCRKIRKLAVIGFFISLPISIFIPSTKTLIAMYTIPPIVNNQQVQQLPANLLKFANDYLTKEDKQ